MNRIIDAIVYQIWWPIQIALLAALLAALFLLSVRLWGWERVRPWVLKLWVPVAILLAAFGLRRQSQQSGYQDRIKQEDTARKEAEDFVDDKKIEVDKLPDDELNDKVDKWSRKS